MVLLFIFLVLLSLFIQSKTKAPDAGSFNTEISISDEIVEIDREFTINLSVKNCTGRIFPFVKLKLNVSSDLISTTPLEFSTWLMPHQVINAEFGFKASKRGRYLIKDITIETGDFLGVKEFTLVKSAYAELVCLPAPADKLSNKSISGGIMGDVSVNRFIFDDPIFHVGYREYTGREPLKQISWKRTAQSGKLMVRIPDYTMENSVLVILDIDEQSEEFVEKNYSLCRALLEDFEARGIKYSLSTNAVLYGMPGRYYFAEGSGKYHLRKMLKVLGCGSMTSRRTKPVLVKESLAHNNTSNNKILISGGQICSL